MTIRNLTAGTIGSTPSADSDFWLSRPSWAPQPRQGRKIPAANLTPLPGLMLKQTIPTGLRPWLNSDAAPRLEGNYSNVFATSAVNSNCSSSSVRESFLELLW